VHSTNYSCQNGRSSESIASAELRYHRLSTNAVV
jgi:hypothetical protein